MIFTLSSSSNSPMILPNMTQSQLYILFFFSFKMIPWVQLVPIDANECGDTHWRVSSLPVAIPSTQMILFPQ